MRAVDLVPFFLLTSCLQIGPSANTDAGSRTQAAGAATMQDGASATTGANCVDFGAGVVLCTSISLCPGVAVDHDVYPNCGFRLPSSSIDLECVCDNVLCPVGSALNCNQAWDLLDSQSELAVCTQSNEGRCAMLAASNPSRSCDRACAADCAGDPLCFRLCGC